MTKELDLLKFVDFVSYTLFFDSIAGNVPRIGDGRVTLQTISKENRT